MLASGNNSVHNASSAVIAKAITSLKHRGVFLDAVKCIFNSLSSFSYTGQRIHVKKCVWELFQRTVPPQKRSLSGTKRCSNLIFLERARPALAWKLGHIVNFSVSSCHHSDSFGIVSHNPPQYSKSPTTTHLQTPKVVFFFKLKLQPQCN